MAADVSAAEVAALHDEIARLRAELDQATYAAREAETAAGELRGELIETYAALARASQMESVLRSTFGGRAFRAARKGRRAIRRLGAAVLPPRAGR